LLYVGLIEQDYIIMCNNNETYFSSVFFHRVLVRFPHWHISGAPR